MEDEIGIEDHGEWLNFRMTHEGKNIPVRISREAMEDHFGPIEQGHHVLHKAYLRNPEAVHARVRVKIDPNLQYTRENPLVIHTTDL